MNLIFIALPFHYPWMSLPRQSNWDGSSPILEAASDPQSLRVGEKYSAPSSHLHRDGGKGCEAPHVEDQHREVPGADNVKLKALLFCCQLCPITYYSARAAAAVWHNEKSLMSTSMLCMTQKAFDLKFHICQHVYVAPITERQRHICWRNPPLYIPLPSSKA